jgi:cation diffusion facilitator CzcD-associated flavoprotein CzcO
VFYGAAGSEARAMEGREVLVTGAGNSAGQAAIHLAGYAASVTMLVRRGSLAATMSDYLIQKIQATPNISVPAAHRGDRRAGHRAAGKTHPPRQPQREHPGRPRDGPVRADRRQPTHAMATRNDRLRPARLCADRA